MGKGEDNRFSRRMFVGIGAAAMLGALSGCSSADSASSATEVGEGSVLPEEGLATTIHLCDTLVAKPGEGESLLNGYLDLMAPLAEAAGVRLVSSEVSPPFWLADDSNVIKVTWAIDHADQGTGWGLVSATRFEPNYVAWWQDIRRRGIEHDRPFYVADDAMEVFHVARCSFLRLRLILTKTPACRFIGGR